MADGSVDDATLSKEGAGPARSWRKHIREKLASIGSPVRKYRAQPSIEKHALFKLRDVVDRSPSRGQLAELDRKRGAPPGGTEVLDRLRASQRKMELREHRLRKERANATKASPIAVVDNVGNDQQVGTKFRFIESGFIRRRKIHMTSARLALSPDSVKSKAAHPLLTLDPGLDPFAP